MRPTPSTMAVPIAVVVVTASEKQRLADGDVHAGVDRHTGSCAEALQLVVLALKRRDDGQHRHRVVHDLTGSRLPCT
jgi:hypothetical protein